MSLRAKLVSALTALSTLVGAATFGGVYLYALRAPRDQLDAALAAQCADEAAHLVAHPGAPPRSLPGPAVEGVGARPRIAALFDAQGRLLRASPPLGSGAASLARLSTPASVWIGRTHLRVASRLLPDGRGARVVVAVPRGDLDREASRLRRALAAAVCVSTAWAVLVSMWLSRRLMRAQPAVISAVRRALDDDLEARVAPHAPGAPLDPLAGAVDALLAKHDRVVTSQRVFLVRAAQELRAPLRVLYDELSYARRDELDEGARRESIERALGDAQGITLLAEDLLTLSRVGSVRAAPMSSLSLRDVALGALDLVRSYAKSRGVSLGVDGDGVVIGRASDLSRMIGHLLDNAIRYSPAGAPVRVIIREDRDTLTLRVRDQGDGVAPVDRPHVFEAFYRDEARRADPDAGPGLGLAIVREIARAHGGEVTLDEPDPDRRGAAFTVVLPKG